MGPLDRREVLVGGAALGLASLARGLPGRVLPRPVLLIDLDDLGRELLTRAISLGYAPNLRDAIATGRSYPIFWAAPLCSPFRSRVLTGLDAYRTGNMLGSVLNKQDVFAGPIGAWMPAGLPGSKVKLGKWHISSEPSFPTGLIAGGYDRFTGILSNVGFDSGTYYDWREWTADASGWSKVTQTQHCTTRIAALTLAEVAAGTELIHTSFQAIHLPLSQPPNDEPPGKVWTGTSFNELRLNTLGHMDYWLGEILAEAIPLGYVVLIACDNGTHQMGKGTSKETGSNTHLIVCGNGVLPGASTRLVQATDLWATVRRLRGDTSLAAADSFDFTDDFLAVPQIHAPREFCTLDWFPVPGAVPPPSKWSRMIRDVRWKYLDQKIMPNGFAQPLVGLWDLETDPAEKVNLLSATLSAEAQAAYSLLLANLQS